MCIVFNVCNLWLYFQIHFQPNSCEALTNFSHSWISLPLILQLNEMFYNVLNINLYYGLNLKYFP